MRLRTYTAPSLAEAMAALRAELGEDAIIVSTEDDAAAGEVHLVAAIEPAEPELAFEDAVLFDDAVAAGHGGAAAAVAAALDGHNLPARLAGRLVAAVRAAAIDDPALALAAALDAHFGFRALADDDDRPLLLVGPPGAGKTVTAAKLAARALCAGRRAALLSTDVGSTGGVEQLAAFARLMKLDLDTAADAPALAAAVALHGDKDLVVIDSVGTNPFSAAELDRLAALAEAAGAEPVVVLAAGGDGEESAEVAAAFAALGARRLLATRLDAARRLGGTLAAAHAGPLDFAGAGIAPELLDGLAPVNPVSLARLLMHGTGGVAPDPGRSIGELA